MDDKLSLGIPDRSHVDAPARRFSLLEERSRVSSIAPALLVASWAFLLKQVMGSGEEERQHGQKSEAGTPAPVHGTDGSEEERTFSSDRVGRGGSPEVGKVFGFVPVNMDGQFAPAVDLDKLAFGRAQGPFASPAPANQNIPVSAPPRAPVGDAKPLGGGGGGGGGGGAGGDRSPDHGKTPPDKKDPPSSDPPPKRTNHAPVVAGSVDLGTGLVNESIIISLSQLLNGASDPDGDALSVQSVQANRGVLEMLGPDRWLYTPEHDESGPIRFSYHISDGTAWIEQTAHVEIEPPSHLEIAGTEGDDILIGTPRDDIIDAKGGDDIVYGREGNDIIQGGNGDDRIVGGDGDDTLFGGLGNDVIFGGAGNDTIFGEDGDDTLFGENGNDLIVGGPGNDFASGGNGNDTILGGPGNDTLQGDEGDDTIDGGTGNDHIDGGSGNDRIIGGDGDDTIFGGAGSDIIAGGDGNDKIDGGSGDDKISGDAGDDTVKGGDGNDQIDGGASNDALCGQDGNDVLRGGEGDDHLDGGAGDDILSGGPGNDTIDGGAGNDFILLTSDGGCDIIKGGTGDDTLDLSAIVFDETVDLPDGTVVICDGQTAQIFEIENVRGGSGRDRLVADDHVNIMTGGEGNDTFVFQSLSALQNDGGPRDHIVDFSVGDKLDLSKVGQESEDFAGKKLFFAGAESANFSQVGAVTYHHEIIAETQEVTVVTGNLNDDSEPEFSIVLEGNIELTQANFIFTPADHSGHHVS